MTPDNLVKQAQHYNAAYRAGNPVVSDAAYDLLTHEIARLAPEHPYLETVEPDDIDGDKALLPERMLSTQKAYSLEAISKWADEVLKAEPEAVFRVTPKLDGFAAYRQGRKLFTRGDGRTGTDISRAFARGLAQVGSEAGPGEIVVDREYFADHLAGKYENSRNVIASVIKEGSLSPEIAAAISKGGVIFLPFAELMGWEGSKRDLLARLEPLWDAVASGCDYDTDGLVIEALGADVRSKMGSTNHHHRWQIAYKKNLEFHDIKVIGVRPQTSKTGRITPVVELEPTKVSGVTISRATGHHYGNITRSGIAEDAVVRVCRSGLVIPYIAEVVMAIAEPHVPDNCPSCGASTYLDGDNLMCSNHPSRCPAQVEGVIRYFFETIGNCDGFGPKAVEQLCAQGGIRTVTELYGMDQNDFVRAGFGEKTAWNLYDELDASLSRPLEDWRWLAAFNIPGVGKGGCERLLTHYALNQVFDLTVDDLVRIDGFAEKTACRLVESLHLIKPQFDRLVSAFTLIETLRGGTVVSPVAGKTVVFTGSLQHGSRKAMESRAKALGAKVGSSVSLKTDYLICGANVGAAKTEAALRLGVTVLTEAQYLTLIEA
jgi:DNA ligase (NAD+)